MASDTNKMKLISSKYYTTFYIGFLIGSFCMSTLLGRNGVSLCIFDSI